MPPEDAEAFADAVLKLAESPVLREECGRNGRALAEREFARDILGGQFVEFLENTAK